MSGWRPLGKERENRYFRMLLVSGNKATFVFNIYLVFLSLFLSLTINKYVTLHTFLFLDVFLLLKA